MTIYQDNAYRVLYSNADSLRELAEVSGHDPETFFEFSDLSNIDLRGQDLRGLSLVGANLAGVVVDETTKIDESQRRLFSRFQSSILPSRTPITDTRPEVVATELIELKHREQMLEAQVKELDAARTHAEDRAEHQARMIETLMSEKERAEAASRTRSRFLANISHELRTPLNAVIGFSDLLGNEPFGKLGDARYKTYAEDIRMAGEHLLSLVNDLLDMSKIEAGKYRLHKEKKALALIVDAVGRMMRGRAAEADLVFQLDPPDPALIVDVDVRAIKQVLINLLANAIGFTPPGGRVRLGVRVEQKSVVIEIADNGIGIPSAELPRLMEPFETLDRADRPADRGNAGLGLPISNALVQLHEGTLILESEIGVGTTAIVRLPL